MKIAGNYKLVTFGGINFRNAKKKKTDHFTLFTKQQTKFYSLLLSISLVFDLLRFACLIKSAVLVKDSHPCLGYPWL